VINFHSAKRYGKRGDIRSIFFIVPILLLIGLSIIVATKLNDEFVSDEGLSAKINQSTVAMDIRDKSQSALNVLDYTFLMVAAGLLLSTIILSFQIRNHPVLFFISLFMLLFVIMLAAIFSNIFNEIADDDNFEGIIDRYGIMDNIFDNLPFYMLIFGAIVLIIFYGKGGDSGVSWGLGV
jgi:hypothetical protein